MYVIKRNGRKVPFDAKKIAAAITKAMRSPSGIYEPGQADDIARSIAKKAALSDAPLPISWIENEVYQELTARQNIATAKAYEGYRAIHEFLRKQNTSDKNIMAIVQDSDEDLRDDNSNKDAAINSTQRDLIAGEVSKDILKRKLLPKDILEAWEANVLYFHDSDYAIMNEVNCSLCDFEDMLTNGTVINKRRIDPPKSFQTACTVLTQIVAQVASSQYGGQTVNGIDRILALFLRKSYARNRKVLAGSGLSGSALESATEAVTHKELEAGIQTLQYQVNTIACSNGQTPFVSFALYFKPDYEYAHEAAMICEEILKQRYQGIKDEKGILSTPVFPKLLYILDEHNAHPNSPYYYLTKLAAKTTARRMYPDYISAPIMRKRYGDVFAPMGCRSFLSPWHDKDGNLKWDGRFNCGVVTINLPQLGILCRGDMDKFWKLFDRRLDICKKALLWRHDRLKGVKSDVAPILWQHGGFTRLQPGEIIDKYLYGGYSTLSLGYIGLYELSMLMLGKSNSTPEGHDFTLQVVKHLHDVCEAWKKETNIGFSLYGTPSFWAA